MDSTSVYKLLQISEHLIGKYGFSQILLSSFQETINLENWFYNFKDPNYQVIRITFTHASSFSFDSNRVDTYLNYFKNESENPNLKFLDIHVCNDEYSVENEPYDYLNLENNFHNGIDVSKIYPEIYNAIHNVEDSEKETNNIIERIKETLNNRLKSKPFYSRYSYWITYTIATICILNFIIGIFLKYKYGNSSAIYVILGADYKTFTYGLREFYRLITYGFVHNDLLHITCNLISLLFMGRHMEVKLGHFKYSLILFFSIICGSLTQEILSDNVICMGISAGIYGLMIVFIITTIENNRTAFYTMLPTIFINLMLNFLSTTAWMAHLGGAIGGFVMYYFLKDYKNIFRISLLIIFILCLIYKYATIKTINTIYAGTDLEIVNILNDLGLKNISSNLFKKLMNLYLSIGG